MKRRSFFSTATSTCLTPAILVSCYNNKQSPESLASLKYDIPATLAGMSLEKLLEDYHHNFFNRYLPFWEKGGIDRETGAVMCILNDDGSVAEDEVFNWCQGMALWVYSFLYNNFGRDTRFLKIAERICNFMVKYMKAENGTWYEKV